MFEGGTNFGFMNGKIWVPHIRCIHVYVKDFALGWMLKSVA